MCAFSRRFGLSSSLSYALRHFSGQRTLSCRFCSHISFIWVSLILYKCRGPRVRVGSSRRIVLDTLCWRSGSSSSLRTISHSMNIFGAKLSRFPQVLLPGLSTCIALPRFSSHHSINRYSVPLWLRQPFFFAR